MLLRVPFSARGSGKMEYTYITIREFFFQKKVVHPLLPENRHRCSLPWRQRRAVLALLKPPTVFLGPLGQRVGNGNNLLLRRRPRQQQLERPRAQCTVRRREEYPSPLDDGDGVYDCRKTVSGKLDIHSTLVSCDLPARVPTELFRVVRILVRFGVNIWKKKKGVTSRGWSGSLFRGDYFGLCGCSSTFYFKFVSN